MEYKLYKHVFVHLFSFAMFSSNIRYDFLLLEWYDNLYFGVIFPNILGANVHDGSPNISDINIM